MSTLAIRRGRAATVLALLTGCAPAPLTPAGARVVVTGAPDPRCALVAMLRGSAGYNGRSAENNAAAVETYLRNQAAERGGTSWSSPRAGAARATKATPSPSRAERR